MDHHCPWTINCVSHRTFPHFFRFLFYSVITMIYLSYLLYIRLYILFQKRSLPSVSPPIYLSQPPHILNKPNPYQQQKPI